MKINDSTKILNNKIINKKDKNFITDCINTCPKLKNIPQESGFYEYYNNLNITKPISFDKIKKLGIPNLQQIENKGVRGESLSADRNNKYLKQVKNYGIDTIVDLRTADYTNKFSEKCKNLGFNFYHIPIDSKNISDKEIINNLPKLFEILDKGNFYIACAQGRHRTDIAIALNYLFNPKYKGKPPYMYGHVENGKMRTQDIFTRANSVYKSMTEENKQQLGWTKEFDETFKQRKQKLVEFNEQ